MRRYLTLLQNEPVVRRLTLIQLITYFGAWFSNVAIYTLLVDLGVNAGVIALVAALYFFPGVLQAPFTGVLIDKFQPKRLMLVLLATEIVSTLLLLLVVDERYLALLFLLIFIRMGAASFYFTIEMSLLPKLLSQERLQDANALHSMVWSVSYTGGMAVSGIVVNIVGAYTAFILDALFFMISLMLLLPLTIRVNVEKTVQRFFYQLAEGLLYIRKNKVILYLILLHSSIALTAFDALVVLLAKHHYHQIIAVPLAIGLIHASRALALVIGPMLLASKINQRTLLLLLLFQGVSIIMWAGNIENFYYSLGLSVVVGLSTTTLWSYTYTLLQNYTDKRFYGRVIAYNDMLFMLTGGLVSLGIGWAYEFGVSLSWITVALGVGFVLAALYYSWLKKRYLDV